MFAKRFFYVSLGILMMNMLIPRAVSAQAPVYLYQWGTQGTGDGQFTLPLGVVTCPPKADAA